MKPLPASGPILSRHLCGGLSKCPSFPPAQYFIFLFIFIYLFFVMGRLFFYYSFLYKEFHLSLCTGLYWSSSQGVRCSIFLLCL